MLSKVDGLCGNFNGNPNDDLVTADGKKFLNYIDFAVHHQNADTCLMMDVPVPSDCNEQETQFWWVLLLKWREKFQLETSLRLYLNT